MPSTGTDWIKAAEIATGGRPRILYRISVNCAKFMAFNSPNSELAHKFLARCDKIEAEFKRMLLARMADDIHRIQPAPATADSVQLANRKRVADVDLVELEIAERRAKLELVKQEVADRRVMQPVELGERVIKLCETGKAAMGALDGRDMIFYKDMIRNALAAACASQSAQLLIEPAASATAAADAGTSHSAQQLRIEPVADSAAIPVVAAAAAPISGDPTRPTAQRPREWPLSAWLLEHGHGRPTLARVQMLGRFVVVAFGRHNGGAKPPQRESYVDGAVRLINHYTDADSAIIEEGIADMKRADKW